MLHPLIFDLPSCGILLGIATQLSSVLERFPGIESAKVFGSAAGSIAFEWFYLMFKSAQKELARRVGRSEDSPRLASAGAFAVHSAPSFAIQLTDIRCN